MHADIQHACSTPLCSDAADINRSTLPICWACQTLANFTAVDLHVVVISAGDVNCFLKENFKKN